MPTRLSKKRLDEAENVSSLAARIVAQKTGQELPTPQPPPVREKNPAAVALGQLGASKGGKARAALLTEEKRIEIAQNAAKARWRRH